MFGRDVEPIIETGAAIAGPLATRCEALPTGNAGSQSFAVGYARQMPEKYGHSRTLTLFS